MMKTYSRKKSDEPDEVILDLNELCRLCMNKEEGLVSIFNEQESTPLTLRIMACVSLEVFEGDGLPNQICHACKYQLEKSYLFRKKCEMSDLKLRQHLKVIQTRSDSAQLDTEEIEPSGHMTNTGNRQDDSREEDDLVDITQVSYIEPDPDTEYVPENITLSTGDTDDLTNRDACTLAPIAAAPMQLKREAPDDDDEEEDENNQLDTSHTTAASNHLYLMDDTNTNNTTNTNLTQLQHQQLKDASRAPEHQTSGRKPPHHQLQNLQQLQRDNTLDTVESHDLDIIAEAVKATLATHPEIDITGEIVLKVDQAPGMPTQVQVTTADGSIIVMELLTEDLELDTLPQQRVHPIDPDDGSDDERDVKPNVHQTNSAGAGAGGNVNDEGELKVFKCPDCNKSFARRIQLRRHASVHMQQRGFSCGICEKWFPTRSALIRHERIHTGERPFQCDVCQKSFAQKEILYRHMMTHTGQKPYNCPHCPRGFTQKEPLRAHLKSHLNISATDSSLHYCTLCPKVFCHASGLSRHLVTHTGKTFKCRECDKSFTDKSSLKRHHRQTLHQLE